MVQCLSLSTEDHLILSSVLQRVRGFGFCDLAVSGMAERCLGRRRDVFRGLWSSKSAPPESSFDIEQLYVGRARGGWVPRVGQHCSGVWGSVPGRV